MKPPIKADVPKPTWNIELNFPSVSENLLSFFCSFNVSYTSASLFPLKNDEAKPSKTEPIARIINESAIAYEDIAKTLAIEPKIIVFFLPIRSERIPVGISKSVLEIEAMEKTAKPRAKEPVTCAK